jgi:hypothetical protein
MRSIEDTYCPYDKPFGEKRGEIIDVQEIFECLKPQIERINPEEMEKWKKGKKVEENLR